MTPEDSDVISQARAFASMGGFNLGSGGTFFPGNTQRRQSRGSSTKQGGGGGAGGSGTGGASAQGGAGGAGRGGWVHLSDRRNPPDFGRIAWPEDILGSVVDPRDDVGEPLRVGSPLHDDFVQVVLSLEVTSHTCQSLGTWDGQQSGLLTGCPCGFAQHGPWTPWSRRRRCQRDPPGWQQ